VALVAALTFSVGCRSDFDPDLTGFDTEMGEEGGDGDGDGDGEGDGDGDGDGDTSGSPPLDAGMGEPTCGDGLAEGTEECDGLDLRGASCTGFLSPGDGNYSGGSLSCASDCTLDFSSCEYCGDGIANGDEACDGTDLDGLTCSDQGFDGGDLSCDTSCNFVEDGCASCEGDRNGMYGTECEQGLTVYDGYAVCVEPCDTSADCVDPSLDACEPNYICLSGGCRIACDVHEDCPTGMECTGLGWCFWGQE